MRTFAKLAVIGLIGSLSLGGLDARATLEIGASVHINARADFEVPLGAHGAWVEVGSYGRCWRPVGVAVGWRPYCDGEWVWTDCGWYWESDEPWAWACYHYGRWVYEADLGWYWVPDVEWAPAWVEWRVGGGFIGWAPCAPAGVIIAPAIFGFVEIGRFHERLRPQTVIVNNTTIINKTTVINNIKHETRTIEGDSRKLVVNEGPGVEMIQKATGRRISAVPIQVAARHTSVPTGVMHKPEQPLKQEQNQTSPLNNAHNSKQGHPKSEEQPKTAPKTEHPPRLSPEPPTKSIAPSAPAPKNTPERPADRGNRGHVVPPDDPGFAAPIPPAKPEEPAGGGAGQGQPRERRGGRD